MTRAATPILIGVGDVVNRSRELKDGLEPMELMLQAIKLAARDAQLSSNAADELLCTVDSIDVVRPWTWPYDNLPGLLAKRLGASCRHMTITDHGGNQPGKILDEAARRIAFGETQVAVITGGEALASISSFMAAKQMPPPGWTKTQKNPADIFAEGLKKSDPKGPGNLHSIGAPIQVYPLYENAFRAQRGQSITENNNESARLYADFAKIAEKNPFAWNFGKDAETEESIETVTKKNRMICFPYPLQMNAFNTVNLSAACILTSVEYATKLGIPQSKWIYPLGGAGTRDSYDFWERPNFHNSPSISRSLDAGLEAAGLSKTDIDIFDFYSCFPIVPKLACEHLGISPTSPNKPISLLGGLTSFGGAGNNYSMHAITHMVRRLRDGKERYGLILANGGTATYQHVVCFSSHPRKYGSPYPERNPLPDVITDVPFPLVDAQAEGDAIIETYTVDFDRDGTPKLGHLVGRLASSDHRFLAHHGDAYTLAQLSSGSSEPIGRRGWVKPAEKGKNHFTLYKGSVL